MTREKKREPISTDKILILRPFHCIRFISFVLTMKISGFDADYEVYAVKNHFC